MSSKFRHRGDEYGMRFVAAARFLLEMVNVELIWYDCRTTRRASPLSPTSTAKGLPDARTSLVSNHPPRLLRSSSWNALPFV
ncbi:hypothetical protein JCM16303_003395 [Sporobolomyces ruberrimus]